MTRLKASNNATTRLVADVTATDTFFDVEDASPFPDPPFRVWVNEEIIEVGSIDRVANRFSDLVRGLENTTPAFHPVGSFVENVFTAGTYQELVDAINSKETPEGAQQKADTAESNAKAYADQKAGQAEDNAKAYAIPKTEKGASNGVATLDSNSKLNDSQIPDKVIYGDNQYGTINVYDNGVGANGVIKSGFYRPNGLGMGVGLMIAIVHPSSGPNYQIQIGGNYAGNDLKFRKCYNGSWTPEYVIFHDGNQPKITVSSTAPSNPKYGDIWIEP